MARRRDRRGRAPKKAKKLSITEKLHEKESEVDKLKKEIQELKERQLTISEVDKLKKEVEDLKKQLQWQKELGNGLASDLRHAEKMADPHYSKVHEI